MRTRSAILALTLSVFGPPVAAQSLFNSAGIGVPTEALDGKARALGDLGIGLRGVSFMPTDPAAVGRLLLSTGVMAGQPSWVDFASETGASGSFQGSRFPLLGIAYPVLSGMMSIQLGSFLDQQFQSEKIGSVDLGTGPVQTIDLFEQDGSVSTLNVGFARMLNPDIAVGVTVGRYAGSVVRILTRTFSGQTAGLDDYVESGKWAYSGIFVTAGVSADITSGIRVAGSLQLPTDLDAKADETTGGADGSFDLPMQLRIGATAALAPGLNVSASAALADWSRVADDLVGTTRAGSANGFGVGIELSRARIFGKEAPLRFGFRRTGLPFAFEDQDASERIFAGGFGLALNTTGGIVLASSDFAIERGRRTGAGITEDFWRATISLILSGF